MHTLVCNNRQCTYQEEIFHEIRKISAVFSFSRLIEIDTGLVSLIDTEGEKKFPYLLPGTRGISQDDLGRSMNP